MITSFQKFFEIKSVEIKSSYDQRINRYVSLGSLDTLEQIDNILNELRDEGCDVAYHYIRGMGVQCDTQDILECEYIGTYKAEGMSSEEFREICTQVASRLGALGSFESEPYFYQCFAHNHRYGDACDFNRIFNESLVEKAGIDRELISDIINIAEDRGYHIDTSTLWSESIVISKEKLSQLRYLEDDEYMDQAIISGKEKEDFRVMIEEIYQRLSQWYDVGISWNVDRGERYRFWTNDRIIDPFSDEFHLIGAAFRFRDEEGKPIT